MPEDIMLDARTMAGVIPYVGMEGRAAEAARALGSPERLAAAALGFGSAGELWANGQVDEELAALLEEALDALPADPSALQSLVLARLADAADDDVLDGRGVDPRLPDERIEHRRAEVGGMPVLERAATPPPRSPQCFDDISLGHDRSLYGAW